MGLKKLFGIGAVVGGMVGGNLSCGGNPVEAQSQGPPGVSGYEVKVEKLFIPAGTTLTLSVDCPLNKVAISGGWSFHGLAIDVLHSFPGDVVGEIPTSTNRNKWSFRIHNTDMQDFVDLYAVCTYAS